MRDFLLLPPEGRQLFTTLLNSIAAQVQFQIQVLLNCIFLQPKNAECDRPLTLTCGLYRVIRKMFRFELSDWDTAKAGFWDQAIRGNEPLRAAVLSEMSADIAKTGVFQ